MEASRPRSSRADPPASRLQRLHYGFGGHPGTRSEAAEGVQSGVAGKAPYFRKYANKRPVTPELLASLKEAMAHESPVRPAFTDRELLRLIGTEINSPPPGAKSK